MNVSDIGEFGLIERLTARLGAAGDDALIVGPGDDAAVWRVGSEYVVATTDTIVEGVHFRREFASWQDIGWKALATNVSDLAAMGAWPPYFALVTLALPADTNVESVEALYDGLAECARTYGVTIAGGDTVRAETVTITVALTGRAKTSAGKPRILRRDLAQPGDAIAVTGTLGDSAGGLRLLSEGGDRDSWLTGRHTRPEPKPFAGVSAAGLGILCAIDVSDGLVQDVGHICESSGVAATINASAVPISDGLRAALSEDALRLACTGGEDYELVIVGRPPLVEKLARELAPNERLTVIGKVIADPQHRARVMTDSGREVRFDKAGWDAFK